MIVPCPPAPSGAVDRAIIIKTFMNKKLKIYLIIGGAVILLIGLLIGLLSNKDTDQANAQMPSEEVSILNMIYDQGQKRGNEVITALQAIYDQLQSKNVIGNEVLGSGGAFEHTYYDAIGTSASPSTLTAAFNSNSSTVVLATGMANVAFAGNYTPKTTNASIYVKLERSIDGGLNFYPYSELQVTPTQILVHSDSFATSTSSAAPFLIPSDGTSTSGTGIGFSWDMTIVADYLRVSIAEQNGTSTAGTVNLQLLLNSN